MKPVTLPQAFWDSMTADMQADIKFLEEKEGLIVLPTGSRLICPDHASDDSDWDLYVLTKERSLSPYLCMMGWSPPQDESSNTSRCHSIRKGKLNLCVFLNAREFEAFKLATEFCVGIGGPTEKAKRVELFERIRYGYGVRDGRITPEKPRFSYKTDPRTGQKNLIPIPFDSWKGSS